MGDENNEFQESESQSNYIRILSHQLKSPINSIQSLLNTIAEGFTGEISPKARYFIEKAVSRSEEAKEMISDLLDYEIYSQNQPTPHEELDLVLLLNVLVNKYVTRAAEKNISLRIDLPLKFKIFILGDSRGLEHAFRNIIENAIKYTPAQGIVTIKLEILEDPQTSEIMISDTGYGIPKSERETIFEPFYRSIKHKSNISGSGLGLPIAKRVVESHKGNITVESEENQGTTFTIILPYINLTKSEARVDKRKKVVIIGGVTAGPKAAARLRRLDEDVDITIIEKSESLSYTACGLPSYISNKVDSPKALMSTGDNTIRDVHFFEAIKNITVLNKTIALAIDREHKTLMIQNLTNKTTSDLPYDILVLATGSEFFVPKIPGIWQKGVYSLHSLDEAKAIKDEFSQKNAKDVCIIGGGLIGTSTAESLIETGARVTILEKEPSILCDLMDREMALKIQNELSKKGVKTLTNVEILKIMLMKNHLMLSTEHDSLHTDLIIVSTGLRPNAALAKNAGLEIGEQGGIKVTKSLQTSDNAIYAVGDCVEGFNCVTHKPEYWPLGGISTKMGRIAADNIFGRQNEFCGSVNTAMFKIFDINVARTGLTLQKAQEYGFDPEAVTIASLDKAHYYENAEYVVLKVIADKKSRVVLGAQGYGRGDVVAKIQLLACAVTQSLTLNDVFNLDLGYAPPFNTPVDIVQTACLVLNNKLDQLFRTITLEEFEQQKDHVTGIVDVSPLSEHTFHAIPGSINIPLENIRLEGIPFEKDKDVILYSQTSSGAYQAYRYLISRGYSHLRVLEGGYVYWAK